MVRKLESAKLEEIKNEKREERNGRQKLLKEKWDMVRWLTQYIAKNQERWKIDGEEIRK